MEMDHDRRKHFMLLHGRKTYPMQVTWVEYGKGKSEQQSQY